MKTALCSLYVAVYYAVANPSTHVDGRYPRYIEFPNGNGVMHTVDLLEPVNIEMLREVDRNLADFEYSLYTRRNFRNAQTLVMNDVNSIRNSNFNSNHPTMIVASGWFGSVNANDNFTTTVKDAQIRRREANVIIFEWTSLAMSSYPTTVAAVPGLGHGLGQFVEFLHSVTGQPYNMMHMVGFSLGAHLVGNAGRFLGGRVARITGLAPIGPLWNLNPGRLQNTDAVYVEAIHTDIGANGLGIGSAVADADFYPNGGVIQHNCISTLCHHNRAYELFTATITHNHLVARQCSNVADLFANICRGSNLHMGNDDWNKSGSGLFRVNTFGPYPFRMRN